LYFRNANSVTSNLSLISNMVSCEAKYLKTHQNCLLNWNFFSSTRILSHLEFSTRWKMTIHNLKRMPRHSKETSKCVWKISWNCVFIEVFRFLTISSTPVNINLAWIIRVRSSGTVSRK
jgi:hypothetical protein